MCLIVYTLHRRSAPYGQNIAGYDADLHADSLALYGPWVSFFALCGCGSVSLALCGPWVSFFALCGPLVSFSCPVWAIGQFLLPCVGHGSVSLALCGPWVSFCCPVCAMGAAE